MSTGAASRKRLAAALDALMLILPATAAVSALGAGPVVRSRGGGLPIADVWLPLALTAAIAVIRWRVLRDVPLLGLSARRGADLTADSGHRTALPPRFGVLAMCLVLAALWPVRAQLMDLRSVPDLEDPLFSAWRVGWFAHQIVADPAHLFDANIFHPAPLTLTYSDAHLLPSALAAPFIWLGADALVASNLLIVMAFPFGALAYFIAAWRLVGDVRAALVAGLLGAWYPFRFEHISHLELQWFFWIPLALVTLDAALARGGWARGAALGAALAAQALSSMYFGLMLAAYLAPFGICLAIGRRVRLDARLFRALAAAAAIASLAATVLGPPYLASREVRGDRSLGTVAEFSAEGRDYTIPNIHSATWGHRLGSDRKMERALFPGATTTALAAAGMVPPLTATGIAAIVSGALAFDWSLGVNGLTYDDLRAGLLPFRALRAPARFSVLVATSMILLAGLAVRRLLSRIASAPMRNLVFAALVVVASVDLRPSFPLVPVWRQPPPIYAAVDRSMVLAEFPMRFGWNISYMYFSTKHWAALLNGYSGFLPPDFDRLQYALGEFPSPSTLALIRQQGATHLTVNCHFYGGDERCRPVLAALDGSRGVRLITRARWEGDEVRLYAMTNDE